jgi:DNA-directed RNA polymerase subunit RPC12/RpoP
MAKFKCPKCGTTNRVESPAEGRVVQCTSCALQIKLPKQVRPVAPAAAKPNPLPVELGWGDDKVPVPQSRDLPVELGWGEDQAAAPHFAEAAGPPDEDEAKVLARLPAGFPVPPTLGRPRFHAEIPALSHKVFSLLGWLVMIVGITAAIFLVFALRRIISGQPLGPNDMTHGQAVKWLMGALPCTTLCIGLAVWLVVRANRACAVVFTAGFIHYDGRRVTVWHWSDIVTVNIHSLDIRVMFLLLEERRVLTSQYRLRHRQGSRFEFWTSRGQRAEQFAHIVERQTFLRMYPAARARLQAGEMVAFPPFGMERAGLTYRRRLTAWSAIGGVTFANGKMHIGGVGTTPLKKVENYHVFLPLLDEQLGRRLSQGFAS